MIKALVYLFFLILCISFNSITKAQPLAIINIAKGCSTQKMKSDLYYLASDQLEGRMMASHGDTLASLFIADEFKKVNLVAPYAGNYFQKVVANKKTSSSSLIFDQKKFNAKDGWHLYPQVDLSLQNIEIVYNQFADLKTISDYIFKNNVKGKAITVEPAVMLKAFDDNTIDSIEAVWKSKGIAAVVWFGNSVTKNLNNNKTYSFLPEYKNEFDNAGMLQPAENAMPEVAFTPERMNDLLAANNLKINVNGSFSDSLQQPVILKNKISVSFENRLQEVHAPNVIGILKGADTTLPCIILSAHHDHDGRNGNEIYYGAVDNASGTAAIIEIATLLNKAVEKGLRPKRTIVFASFTGEERGLLGSFYYLSHPLYAIQNTYGVLNIDMMGRVDTFYSGKRADSNYAYILVKDSLHNFRKNLYAANSSLNNIFLDTHYEEPKYTQRRLQGSDQYPFYLKGIPFIRIDCGFCKDYHKPTDTPDKINYDLLTKQTQLAFLTLWNMANN